MMKQYESLMLITPQGTADEVLTSVEAYLRGGGRWVQLRLKDTLYHDRVSIGHRLSTLCNGYGAICIINDSPEVALAVGAHGVHLGKYDMSVADARLLLGPDAIIGGTANTLDDMEQLVRQSADYIGLGPFRFTTTKKNLSPVLGLEGYTRLMNAFRSRGHVQPVTAIGGIVADDVGELIATGISGIAVSGVIAKHSHPDEITAGIIAQINQSLSSNAGAH